MNKEEILAKSRKENENRDPYTLEVCTKAANLAGVVILVLASIFYALEIMFTTTPNFGMYALVAIYNATNFLYRGIKTKQKIFVISGIAFTVATLAFCCMYVWQNADRSNVQ